MENKGPKLITGSYDERAKELLEAQNSKFKYGTAENVTDFVPLGFFILLEVPKSALNFKTGVIVPDKVKDGIFKVIAVSKQANEFLNGSVKPGNYVHTQDVRDYLTRDGLKYFMTTATDLAGVYEGEIKVETNVVE